MKINHSSEWGIEYTIDIDMTIFIKLTFIAQDPRVARPTSLKKISNNFIQNKKLHASFFERQIINHQFTKVNASDLRRTGSRNSAGPIFFK